MGKLSSRLKNPKCPKHLKTWLKLWVVLYLAIIITGIILPKSVPITVFTLSGVLLCSIYSIVTFPQDHWLQAAMLTTFVADCIMASDNISVIGLTVFFLAQCLHLYRLLAPPETRFRVVWLIIIGSLAMVLNYIFGWVPPLYIIVGFYALALTLNLLLSWRWRQAEPKSFYANCALIGFILFACCDLCTVMSYLALMEILPAFCYVLANFLAWFFYYPSQILVSNSSKCATMKIKEGKC